MLWLCILTNVPLWWEILLMEEVGHVENKEYMETLYFLLSFAENLKMSLKIKFTN